jgi:hypothetical protein
VAELILFADSEYGGLHTHVFATTLDLSSLKLFGSNTGGDPNANWNDKVSSFVILSGIWRFFKDAGLANAVADAGGNPIQLGPQSPGTKDASGNVLNGHFPVLPPGFPNDTLSSVQLVSE